MMLWFIPLGLGVAMAGTRSALQSRHQHQERAWWLLAVMSWLPIFCWFLAQFVVQDF
jgi:hypothetical protein